MGQRVIVSVTANTTLDQTLFVPVLPLNRTIRATGQIISMGGKPTDASWILGEMGLESLALGFYGGAFGHKVVDLLAQKGVRSDFITVRGETRMNTVIVIEDGSGQLTVTTSTLIVDPPHVDELHRRLQAVLPQASVVILGGTLPQGMTPQFYSEVIGLIRAAGVPTIFDADQPNLSVGLSAGPTYVKPNQHELEALMGHPIPDVETAYRAGLDILARYGTRPVITLGEIGALAVLGADRAFYVPPLPIEVVSTSGAGDAMLAGLAAAIHRGLPIEEGVRLGAAASAAVCIQPGTAMCDRADIERFLPQVELRPYP
ncbi:MAG: 1-phosphofructokinase family hexose kinase [Anaerolineae bacterium]|nr:1-phosphofructokinase family hexose kinase [Anaerolineae bacterium]MDW8173168.1 1-phosphofructokinase family hexose kinase [Anaerolineae bacterium]